MDVNLQEKEEKAPNLPILANSATFGEGVHKFVFGNVVNFWINLGISAGFTYFVKHSKTPIFGASNPDAFYNKTVNGVNSLVSRIPGISEGKARGTSKAMADALLLTTGGTVVMWPSIWLGEKFKAPMVKALDRLRYGKDAVENDPSLQYRHMKLDTERKPTALGAFISRFVAMAVVQVAAFFAGHSENFINNAGKKHDIGPLKKFPGVDPLAEKIGDGIGHGMVTVFPEQSEKLNAKLFQKNYGAADVPNASNTGRAIQDFSKYVSIDTLYTLLTALSIGPIVGLLKKLPGMSYDPQKAKKAEAPARTPAATATASTRVITQREEEESTAPKIQVSEIRHDERLHAAHHHGVTA